MNNLGGIAYRRYTLQNGTTQIRTRSVFIWTAICVSDTERLCGLCRFPTVLEWLHITAYCVIVCHNPSILCHFMSHISFRLLYLIPKSQWISWPSFPVYDWLFWSASSLTHHLDRPPPFLIGSPIVPLWYSESRILYVRLQRANSQSKNRMYICTAQWESL